MARPTLPGARRRLDRRRGNVVVVVGFDGSIDLGGGPLVGAGGRDMVVVKFDSAGDHLWSRRCGGALFDYADSVATDAAGAVIFGGRHDLDRVPRRRK